MKDFRLETIFEVLDPPSGFRPWHGGPTLMGSLRGINAEKAAWKPAPDRKSIWGSRSILDTGIIQCDVTLNQIQKKVFQDRPLTFQPLMIRQRKHGKKIDFWSPKNTIG